MTSVVRRSGLTLEMPATYLPSHFRRNLKFLYGSTRLEFTVKFAMGAAVRRSVLPAQNPSVKSPFPAEPRAHHSSPTLPRCALCFARCFFAWIIRTFWPRLFWRVCRRPFSRSCCAASLTARTRASSLSHSSLHASSLLADWERSAWQRTSVPVGRCRSHTVEDVLLIFCPPGPPPRMNLSSTSDAGIPSA